ncbi:MAG TPA: BTAD domain-containing putative transcriptional regulator, partial [Lentzea sp.]
VRCHPAALALAQRRLAVTLAHADTSIDEGRPALAVPALRALLADEPLHEGLHARLMLALAGCGQQSAALELHAALKERLADELGLEPGAELREAHLRVLRGQLTVATEPVSVPRQLPAAPERFTGRERELAALDSGRGGTVVISAIGGAGGIGKTWLALTWAHRNAARFPDGQLYVNLRGYDPVAEPVPAEVALRGFLHALGVDPQGVPADLDGQAALYRSLVADRTMLVVLDNARDSAQVAPLLPGNRTSSVLVTSRSTLPGLIATQGAQAISLHTLSDEQARDLLSQRLDIAAEPGAVEDVLRWCGGLPLALGIVAARAASVSLTDLAAEMRATGSRLTALGTGDPLADLRVVFDTSLAALSPAAAVLFRQLGIAPGPDIGLAAATAISGKRTRSLLDELVAAHLVDEYVPGRYRMHDLVRLYAAEKCVAAEREDALRLVVDHYLHSAIACVAKLCPHRPTPEVGPPLSAPHRPVNLAAAMAWTEAERPALLDVIALRLPGVTWQLATALDVYHWRCGQVRDATAVWTVCREVAEQEGARAVVAQAEANIGDGWATLGDFPAARTHLERAIVLAEEIGDLTEEARARNSLAWAWEGKGEHRKALRHARKALWLYRALDRPQFQADMLNCIGWCLIRLGHRDEGRARCEEALALCREHGHVDGTAHASRSLGELALDVGDHQEAVRRLVVARDLFRDLHHPFGEAGVASRLGDAFRALGDEPAAALAYREALALYESQHRAAAARR